MTASPAVIVLLALAGGAGAAARFAVDGLVRARRATAFPFGTFVVNVSGSLAIGIVTGCVLAGDLGETWRLVLATGFCGGYTTFSTATVESVNLARSGRARLAVANSVGTLLLTVLAVAAGIGVVRVVSGGW